MGLCDDLSHCKVALVIAVLMDLLGGASLLVGVFASLKLNGEECGDVLVYSGILFLVASLAGWVLWYSGNIEGLPPKKEHGHLNSAVDRLARRVSRKIFSHRRNKYYSQSNRV
ncbi:transmembrane protein 238-like [Xiphophorus maculatus]|uniref:Transmembrane protein 238a n=2 Tax=Xiphophorus TaxID=8082 RepID=A0A3B5R0N9_XIPMA|nr:transmembrane protein 238-like [Xiphophorus maculatus]XP_027891828.1 transmembrane protein 238-like [Xiphophorus couchianus]XP_027891829.1 transmembrane protein 238-like [Xiphophorus couchianus]XP_027891830.1 transmembrane protein 238-like [Xiphophorus couchianus]